MNRIRYIDTAKAIAIIAVVIGHTTGIPEGLSAFVFTFHMPLFFIASGYFMKIPDKISDGVKKDALALLLPYAVTCLITIGVAAVQAIISGKNPGAAALKWLFASLYGSGSIIASWAGNTHIIGAIWFLLALFFAKIVIYSVPQNTKMRWPIYIAIAVIGYLSSSLTWLPLSIQAGLAAIPFVAAGSEIKKHDLFVKTLYSKNVVLYIGTVGMWIFCIIFCGKFYMVGNNYKNGLLDVAGAFAGVFTIMWICILAEKYLPHFTRVMNVIGCNTLPMLCAHIIELNLTKWKDIYALMGGDVPVFARIVLRFALITVICLVFRLLPVINKIYYPQLRKKKQTAVTSA